MYLAVAPPDYYSKICLSWMAKGPIGASALLDHNPARIADPMRVTEFFVALSSA
jgi:hypothetical protein